MTPEHKEVSSLACWVSSIDFLGVFPRSEESESSLMTAGEQTGLQAVGEFDVLVDFLGGVDCLTIGVFWGVPRLGSALPLAALGVAASSLAEVIESPGEAIDFQENDFNLQEKPWSLGEVFWSAGEAS